MDLERHEHSDESWRDRFPTQAKVADLAELVRRHGADRVEEGHEHNLGTELLLAIADHVAPH